TANSSTGVRTNRPSVSKTLRPLPGSSPSSRISAWAAGDDSSSTSPVRAVTPAARTAPRRRPCCWLGSLTGLLTSTTASTLAPALPPPPGNPRRALPELLPHGPRQRHRPGRSGDLLQRRGPAAPRRRPGGVGQPHA